VCRELELFSATLVAIDGSKFKAVNSRDKNFTKKSVKRRLEKTQANIDRYLAKLDAVDNEEPEIREVTATALKQKIASMEAKMEALRRYEVEVEAHPDNQVSLTDPDARSMMKAGGGSTVSYNVQTAVDSQHHLIAAHEVTNAPSDRSQLCSMAEKAQLALQAKALIVIPTGTLHAEGEILDQVIYYIGLSKPVEPENFLKLPSARRADRVAAGAPS
jgi:BMFP domain-containing protein YqiC